jgi:hypothetical protein
MTLWGPKAEHQRLAAQRMEELVARYASHSLCVLLLPPLYFCNMLCRYCNMEKVADFLSSLETDLRSIFGQSDDEYDKLPMAVELSDLLGRVQSRKKKVLSYLSHKLVLFDLYEPICDRLFAPDPSQKNPVARPFRITPLLTECALRRRNTPPCRVTLNSRFVDPLLSKLAPMLPPMFADHVHASFGHFTMFYTFSGTTWPFLKQFTLRCWLRSTEAYSTAASTSAWTRQTSS